MSGDFRPFACVGTSVVSATAQAFAFCAPKPPFLFPLWSFSFRSPSLVSVGYLLFESVVGLDLFFSADQSWFNGFEDFPLLLLLFDRPAFFPLLVIWRVLDLL